jgi:hypothetical protein
LASLLLAAEDADADAVGAVSAECVATYFWHVLANSA